MPRMHTAGTVLGYFKKDQKRGSAFGCLIIFFKKKMSIKELQPLGPGKDVAKAVLLRDLVPPTESLMSWGVSGPCGCTFSPPRTRAEKGSRSDAGRGAHTEPSAPQWPPTHRPAAGLLPVLISLLHPFCLSGLFVRPEAAAGGAAPGGSQPTLCPGAAGRVRTSSCKNSPRIYFDCVQLIYFPLAPQTAMYSLRSDWG